MSLTLNGERTTGEDVRSQNVTACMAVSNILKSSLGPLGLDKMLVDEIGDVTITNDGATILKLLNVEHPAAKVLVELSDLQDKEVGDGTTSVVILAAELMQRANNLYKQKIHPTSIISGYKLAMRECVKYIKDHLIIPAELINDDILKAAARTAMSSKIIGAESTHFSDMVVSCVKSLKRTDESGKIVYPIENTHILKCHGKSSLESELVNGFALNCTRASMQMPQQVTNAKIALLDFDLQRHRMQMGVEILLNRPDQLDIIAERENDITKERIKKILDAGANVIFTTKGIDDMSMKYFVEAKCIAVRRVKKDEMDLIASATGGTVLSTLSDLEGNEIFDPKALGKADSVSEDRVGDGELLYVKGCLTTQAVTIVLRGANEYMLDEMERSLHDSLCVIKRILESKSVIVGGGAVDAALSIYLERFATTLGTREQLAIQEFSEALLIIPKTLAVNAAKDASDLLSKLCSKHNLSQTRPDKDELKYSGLDLIEGAIVNNFKAGVLEPATSKVKSIRFATEAAITILRIDDMIKINPKQEQTPGNSTPPIH